MPLPEIKPIDETLWAEVQERGLEEGAHSSAAKGYCAMEAVAYITGEPFSDHPACVSPCIAAFMRAWNDALPDTERSILFPLLPKLIGTVAPEMEERRGMMAVDWFVRAHTPAWLDLAGLTKQAASLRVLPEITAAAQMPSLRRPLEVVRDDASAAWSAAWSAAEEKLQATKLDLQQSAITLVERMCAVAAEQSA